MDIGSIFLILALLIPVAIFISRPLVEQRNSRKAPSNGNFSALLADRDRIVSTIQELDDDYNLGKVPSENYPSQRMTLLQNGADILRQIDAYQVKYPMSSAEDRLEEAITSRRHVLEAESVTAVRNGNAVPPVPDDELEQRIASRRRSIEGKASGFCPQCGRPVHELDRFCPKCGATLV